MRSLLKRSFFSLLLITAMVGSITHNQLEPATAAKISTADPNPPLNGWTGPYGGVPRFDLVKVELFKPAMEAAMAENLAEVDKIANNSVAPTLENTIVAMERAGQDLVYCLS